MPSPPALQLQVGVVLPVGVVPDTLGAVGAVVSPVTAKLLVAALVLPARSVSLTLNRWVVPLTTVAV